jgi:hypothetical protein
VVRGNPPFRFEPEAREDLRSGVLWYEERRKDLGVRFASEVRRAIALGDRQNKARFLGPSGFVQSPICQLRASLPEPFPSTGSV